MHFRGQRATYRVIHPVSTGGDVNVYRALASNAHVSDAGSPPEVALKHACSPGGAHTLRREAAILRRVARAGNGHMPVLRDAGEEGGLPWVATSWLERGTLSERSNEPWESARITRFIHSLAQGLSQLHAVGVVHADLCPANIGFDNDDRPVLLDFGAAADVWEAKTEGSSGRLAKVDASLGLELDPSIDTDAGTVGYVAPERLLGGAWDTRADIYSLACIWYQLLTGRPVFASDTAQGVSRQHVDAAPLPPSRHGVLLAPNIERLLLRSLAKEPHQRTARASEIVEVIGAELGLPTVARALEQPIIFRSRLHGRATAVATLRARLMAAKSGAGGLLVVGGPSGSGKTRLQSTAQELAAELDFACLTSTARETVRDLPIASAEREFDCFAEPLSLLAQKLARAPLSQAVLTELAPLGAFDAELEARLPGVARPVASDAMFQQLVFDALIKALELLAVEQPLIVALDDAQFADDLTLRFLRSASISRLRQLPVLLMIGWNTSRADPFSSAYAEALRIGPLSAALTAAMLRDMLGATSLDATVVEIVQRATQGSPLAISELVTAAAREQLWSRNGEHWTLADCGETSRSLADRVRARVEGLPQPIPRVAGLAAVLGQEFSAKELSQISSDRDAGTSDEDALELESALDMLLLHRVVVPAGPGTYRFAHGIYREVCEDLLDQNARRNLHRTLAARLAASASAALLQKRIGLHHAAADESRACVTPLRRAARAALRVHAIEDAVRLLQLAWYHARRSCATRPLAERASRTGWDLLRLLMRAADHQGLRSLGAELLDVTPTPPLLRARILRLLALSHRITGNYAKVSELLDTATDELERSGAALRPSLQRELLEHGIMRVSVHYSLRELTEASSVLRELRPLMREAAGPTQRAKVYMWQANVIALRARYAFSRRAVAYERRAIAAHARTQPLSEEYVMSKFDLAFMLLLGGPKEWSEAARLLDEAHTLAEHLNDAVLICRVVTYRALAARRNGHESRCHDLADVALSAAENSGLRGYVGAARACQGWVSLRRGEDAHAEQSCVSALASWNGQADAPLAKNCYPFQWLALFPLLAVRLNAERIDECLPVLQGLLDASQARLRRPIMAKLTLAAERWSGASERERVDSLDACLRSAAKYRYV